MFIVLMNTPYPSAHLSASVYLPPSISLCLFLKEGAVRLKSCSRRFDVAFLSFSFSFPLPLHLNMNAAFCMGRMPPVHFKAALGSFKGSEGGELDLYCLILMHREDAVLMYVWVFGLFLCCLICERGIRPTVKEKTGN